MLHHVYSYNLFGADDTHDNNDDQDVLSQGVHTIEHVSMPPLCFVSCCKWNLNFSFKILFGDPGNLMLI